jgi:hypothetical protein
VLALVLGAAAASGSSASAFTGQVLRDFVPGGTTGNGRGVAFDGTNLYYTLFTATADHPTAFDYHIYKVSTSGAALGSITVAGDVAQGGPLAWDGKALWTADYSQDSTKLFRIDPATGAVRASCDYLEANAPDPAVSSGHNSVTYFPDGLAWTGKTLWLNAEGSENPGNYAVELSDSCKIQREYQNPSTGGDGASGMAFVADPFRGDKLWHTVEGDASKMPALFETDTRGVPTGIRFSTPHQEEGLAFDPVTFAPKCALWANSATLGSPNHLTAYEIPCPEQPITASGDTISATEAKNFTDTVATVNDPDPHSTAAEYSATIDWGDGSTSAGTVSGPTGGPFVVRGTHKYADEGTYTVKAAVTDTDTPNNNATAISTANVADAPLTAGASATTGGTEGTVPASVSFTFHDANSTAAAADFTATIDWGDGTATVGTVSGPTLGAFKVTGSHLYAEEGAYPVHVAVTDDGGSTTAADSTAKPDDAPLAASCATSAASPQGFAGPVATFTDANPNGSVADFTARITWGDGSSSAGTVSGPSGGPFTVNGTHTYTSTGPETITTTISDDGGSNARVSCSVVIFVFVPFVIGDQNSAKGTHVTFWGAQWWSKNSLSGGPAPASFKGFADSATEARCGTSWVTGPGNSSKPPNGPLPAFIGVIVASKIGQIGPRISGDTSHIVVVKTNPGYQPNPGHAGTGTVDAQFC